MRGLHITRTVQIVLSLTAGQWDAFETEDGVDDAALEINRTIEEAVNSGGDRHTVARAAHAVLSKYARYGFADSEPVYKLDRVLDAIFEGEG